MILEHLDVSLPTAATGGAEPGDFIPVFHRWVAEQAAPVLLIDVADYRHLPGGPGILLVGHEGDFGIAPTGEGLRLRYVRKAPVDGSNADRLREALESLGWAVAKLEADPAFGGSLGFKESQLELTVNDRLLAPNHADTFAAIEPELRAFFPPGEGTAIAHLGGDPRRRFSVAVRSAAPLWAEGGPATREAPDAAHEAPAH